MAKRVYYRTRQTKRRRHKTAKNVFRKTTSFVLGFLVVFQTIAGIFLPVEMTLAPPYVKLWETKAAGENWYDANWTKRKAITVTENSGTILTNYQVKITVAYDFDMQADFDDVRFTDENGSTLIDNWLESKTATTADFWVKLPTLTASSTKTIYAYYGNTSAASASNLANTFGASSATSAIPGCTLNQACIVSLNQTISTSGTYGHPYIRINSGVTLTVTGDNIIAYFDSIGRFDIQGTLSSTGGGNSGCPPRDGGTYWGTGSGGTGGNGNNCGIVTTPGSTYGGAGEYGYGGPGCPWSGCPGSGGAGSYGGGAGWDTCGNGGGSCVLPNGRGAFLSIKTGILGIPSGGSIVLTGQPGCVGRDGGHGSGGVLLQMDASKLMAFSGSITLITGNGFNSPCGTGGGGGGGILSYINYGSFVGTGAISLTAGSGGSLGGGGTATLITPYGTQTGSPAGATGGATSKTFTTGGSEPTITIGTECTPSCSVNSCDDSCGGNFCEGIACTADTNQCTDDICSSGSCTHPNDNTNTCDDGNACTDSDVCSVGFCAGVAEVCGNTVCRVGCETPATCPADCLCGNGIVSGDEVCDKNGNVGCATGTCKTDCSGCIACTIESNLAFLGKPVVCIVQDTTKWILSIIGGIALLMLILGGAYYMFSGDNPKRQESAKKMITYAIIGIILILVSYVLLALFDRIFVQP